MSTHDHIKLMHPFPCINCSDVKGFYENFSTSNIIKDITIDLESCMMDYVFPGVVEDISSYRYSYLIKRRKNWEEEGFSMCDSCKEEYISLVKLHKEGMYVMDSIKFYLKGSMKLGKEIYNYENDWIKCSLRSNGVFLENKFNEKGYIDLIRKEQKKIMNYCSSIENKSIRDIIEEKIVLEMSELDICNNSYVNMVNSYDLQKSISGIAKDGLRADLVLLSKDDFERAKEKALKLEINSLDLDIKSAEWYFEKEADIFFGMFSGPNNILRKLNGE